MKFSAIPPAPQGEKRIGFSYFHKGFADEQKANKNSA